MGKICEQFEAEQATDGEVEHKARFEKVLDLMQQVRRETLQEGKGLEASGLGVQWATGLPAVNAAVCFPASRSGTPTQGAGGRIGEFRVGPGSPGVSAACRNWQSATDRNGNTSAFIFHLFTVPVGS